MSEQRHALAVADEAPVGLRVRLARVAAGLEQAQMAAALGVSQRTYQRIEDDTRPPRRAELIAIAQITGQELEFFGASLDDDAEERVLPPPLPVVNDEEADAR